MFKLILTLCQLYKFASHHPKQSISTPMPKTDSVSSIRKAAQRKLLDKIRLKYARRMGFQMRRIARAVREATAIEKELKEEFAAALGDKDHLLNKDATFEPFFTPGFKETKFLAEHIIKETNRLIDGENAEN